MDKENKDIVTANTASYDPDAAELLKDLEDDDDEEYQPVSTTSQANRSIVNILNSSTNLESLATVPAYASSATPQTTASKMASSSDLTGTSAQTVPASHAEISPVLASETRTPSADSVDTAKHSSGVTNAPDVTQPLPAASDAVAEKTAQDKTDAAPISVESADSAAAKSAIKPFEPKPVEQKAADPIKPAEKAQPKHDEAEAAIRNEKPADEAEAFDPKQAPANSKKPPVPPPMPSMPGTGRVLREGEMIITQEMLNDLLPGGKNDEARDLASFKFTDNNWYTQVFNEDFFRTVPKSSPRQTLREAKFIMDRLGIQRGARVLDLCCGYGRHTLELAKHGFDMVGLDLSMVMLKKALADAQANGQAIKFVHGDMRKLSFKAIFDAIYNVQTSFGYFDDQSNFKVLQGVFNALKPGGVFLIETINRDFIVNDLPLRLWWKGIDCTLLEEIDSEAASGLLKVQRSFVFDDNQRAPWEQKIQIRLYTANEMRALLTRAGFKVVELSGDYSLPGAYFGATSPKNIFVAEKPLK